MYGDVQTVMVGGSAYSDVPVGKLHARMAQVLEVEGQTLAGFGI